VIGPAENIAQIRTLAALVQSIPEELDGAQRSLSPAEKPSSSPDAAFPALPNSR